MHHALGVGGAIRSAVCFFEVVAPPISSGTVSPCRVISVATSTIRSSEGVIRPDSPIDVDLLGASPVEMSSVGTITPRSTTS
jgi:hypothetical protein